MNTNTLIFKIYKIQLFVTICDKSFFERPNLHEQNHFITKQLTEEKDLCKTKHSSYMMVVSLAQYVKTYPTTKCNFLLILKKGYPYSSSGMVYQHIPYLWLRAKL